MKKEELNCWAILCFGSTVLNFMISQQKVIIFPRDRILHTALSFAIWMAVIYLTEKTDFRQGCLKYVTVCFLILRTMIIVYNFAGYFSVYYGSNTVVILVLTAALILLSSGFGAGRIRQMYIITLLFNAAMLFMIFAVNIGNLNILNLYSNSTQIVFSWSKLYMFFDVITLAVIIKEKNKRLYVQKRYMICSLCFIVSVTLLQGLCIKGNMMYSITPLQSLFQIYSGNTIKRIDYYLAIVQSVNYFVTVVLYIATIKTALNLKKEMENEDN